jgi:hypothetical protein
MRKTLRIWNGCKAIALVIVGEDGGMSVTAAGGAGNSTIVDIEIDPWAGLLVEHGLTGSPVVWRAVEGDIDEAFERGRQGDSE